MISEKFEGLHQQSFDIDITPDPILNIIDIAAYNDQEGLSLNADEVEYLNQVSKKIDRPLTDSEVFGFSQVNSEHCRHKIFNGTFIIDGEENQPLFSNSSKKRPNNTPIQLYRLTKITSLLLRGLLSNNLHLEALINPIFIPQKIMNL